MVGPPGSGKSTLIRALLPGVEVDPSEARPYRLYEAHGLRVVEVCGKPEALGMMVIRRPPWELAAGLLLVDGTREQRVDGRAVALVAQAPRRALVLTKLDAADPGRVEAAKGLAGRLNFEFFAVSALKGLGMDELKRWLLGAAGVPAAPPTPAPLPAVDVIPVPAPGALDAGWLSELERRVLSLCDGRRSVAEIARVLGLPYGVVKGLVDELHARRLIRDLRVTVLR